MTSVELDPAIKYIAQRWYHAGSSRRQSIVVKDGVVFIKEASDKGDDGAPKKTCREQANYERFGPTAFSAQDVEPPISRAPRYRILSKQISKTDMENRRLRVNNFLCFTFRTLFFVSKKHEPERA